MIDATTDPTNAVETLARLKNVAAEIRELSGKSDAREALLSEAKSAHASAMDLFHGRMRELVREKGELEDALELAQKELGDKDKELRALQRKLEENAAATVAVQQRLDAAVEEKKDLQNKFGTLRQELEAAVAARTKAELARTRDKQDFEHKLADAAERMREVEARVAGVEAEKKKAEEKTHSLQKEIGRVNELKDEAVRAMDEKLREALATRDAALREKATAEDKLRALQEQWERMHS